MEYLSGTAIIIMLKNEEDNIENTLRPYLTHGFNNFLILDTGSTDNTIVNIEKLFSNFNNRNLIIRKIVNTSKRFDYSKYRNITLDIADEIFPNCLFCIFPDAEWYPRDLDSIKDDYERFKNVKPNSSQYRNSYITNVFNIQNNTTVIHTRFIRLHVEDSEIQNIKKPRFVDEVHEYIPGNNRIEMKSFSFRYNPGNNGKKKTHERMKDDIEYFLEVHRKTRTPRSCYYLARSYESLGDLKQASKFYTVRFEMFSNDHVETFESALRNAECYRKMSNKINAIEWFLKAYNYDSQRVEPLLSLAGFYEDLPHVGLIYIETACRIQNNYNRVSNIDMEALHKTRWEMLARFNYKIASTSNNPNIRKKYLEAASDAIEKTITFNTGNARLTINRMLINEALGKSTIERNFLVLILYSEDKPEYIEMASILQAYHEYLKIPYYFYDYDENLNDEFRIDGNMIYIRPPSGFIKEQDGFLPGILDKTLKSFKLVNHIQKERGIEIEYVVRTNVSSILNYKLINAYLDRFPVDYVGPTNYTGFSFDLKSGLTEEKRQRYANVQWVAGTCIIMSMKCINFLVKRSNQIMELEMIDDVGIGCYLWPYTRPKNSIESASGRKSKISENDIIWMGQMGHDITCHSRDNFKYEDNFFMFRNRDHNEDRSKDIIKMKAIVKMLTFGKVNLSSNPSSSIIQTVHSEINLTSISQEEMNFIFQGTQNHFREMYSINFGDDVDYKYNNAIISIPSHPDYQRWNPKINSSILPDCVVLTSENIFNFPSLTNIASKMIVVILKNVSDFEETNTLLGKVYTDWLTMRLKDGPYINEQKERKEGSFIIKKPLNNVNPITFSIPKEKITEIPIELDPNSRQMISPLIPGDMSTYIYNDEESYYKQYQESNFALSPKKAGWDCMRHYEILANNCIPVITNVSNMPTNIMFDWFKPGLIIAEQMYNKYKETGEFDSKSYLELLNIMKTKMKLKLSSDKVAERMLKRIDISPDLKNKKILFLSGKKNPDYLRCLTLIGLKQLYGSQVHDYPRIDHIYNDYSEDITKLYGKGMTYSRILDPSTRSDEDDKNLKDDIQNHVYDLIIYGSFMRGTPYLDLVFSSYERSEIIMLHGEDNPILFRPYDGVHIFACETI